MIRLFQSLCMWHAKLLWSRLILQKAMAHHSSTLAWKIPWTKKPDRLQPMGLHRIRHAAAAAAKSLQSCLTL